MVGEVKRLICSVHNEAEVSASRWLRLLSETVGRPVKSFSDASVLEPEHKSRERKIFKNDASILEINEINVGGRGGGRERKGGFM